MASSKTSMIDKEGFQNLEKETEKWSLDADVKLLSLLDNFSQKFSANSAETLEKVSKLRLEASETSIALHNTLNDFSLLKNSKFIENRVYDDDEAFKSHDNYAEKPKQPTQLEFLTKALTVGENALSFWSENRVTEDDFYNNRALPYIVGSRGFESCDVAGLGEEMGSLGRSRSVSPVRSRPVSPVKSVHSRFQSEDLPDTSTASPVSTLVKEWGCETCTLLNKPDALECVACGSIRDLYAFPPNLNVGTEDLNTDQNSNSMGEQTQEVSPQSILVEGVADHSTLIDYTAKDENEITDGELLPLENPHKDIAGVMSNSDQDLDFRSIKQKIASELSGRSQKDKRFEAAKEDVAFGLEQSNQLETQNIVSDSAGDFEDPYGLFKASGDDGLFGTGDSEKQKITEQPEKKASVSYGLLFGGDTSDGGLFGEVIESSKAKKQAPKNIPEKGFSLFGEEEDDEISQSPSLKVQKQIVQKDSPLFDEATASYSKSGSSALFDEDIDSAKTKDETQPKSMRPSSSIFEEEEEASTSFENSLAKPTTTLTHSLFEDDLFDSDNQHSTLSLFGSGLVESQNNQVPTSKPVSKGLFDDLSDDEDTGLFPSLASTANGNKLAQTQAQYPISNEDPEHSKSQDFTGKIEERAKVTVCKDFQEPQKSSTNGFNDPLFPEKEKDDADEILPSTKATDIVLDEEGLMKQNANEHENMHHSNNVGSSQSNVALKEDVPSLSDPLSNNDEVESPSKEVSKSVYPPSNYDNTTQGTQQEGIDDKEILPSVQKMSDGVQVTVDLHDAALKRRALFSNEEEQSEASDWDDNDLINPTVPIPPKPEMEAQSSSQAVDSPSEPLEANGVNSAGSHLPTVIKTSASVSGTEKQQTAASSKPINADGTGSLIPSAPNLAAAALKRRAMFQDNDEDGESEQSDWDEDDPAEVISNPLLNANKSLTHSHQYSYKKNEGNIINNSENSSSLIIESKMNAATIENPVDNQDQSEVANPSPIQEPSKVSQSSDVGDFGDDLFAIEDSDFDGPSETNLPPPAPPQNFQPTPIQESKSDPKGTMISQLQATLNLDPLAANTPPTLTLRKPGSKSETEPSALDNSALLSRPIISGRRRRPRTRKPSQTAKDASRPSADAHPAQNTSLPTMPPKPSAEASLFESQPVSMFESSDLFEDPVVPTALEDPPAKMILRETSSSKMTHSSLFGDDDDDDADSLFRDGKKDKSREKANRNSLFGDDLFS